MLLLLIQEPSMFVRATSKSDQSEFRCRLQHRGLFTAVVDTPEAPSEVDDDDDTEE